MPADFPRREVFITSDTFECVRKHSQGTGVEISTIVASLCRIGERASRRAHGGLLFSGRPMVALFASSAP